MNNRRMYATLIATLALLLSVQSIQAGSHKWWSHNRDRIRGSGDLVTEVRELEKFDVIDASGSFDIYVTIGKTQEVKITFDDNIIEYVETEVRHGELRIKTKKNISYSTRSRNRIDIVVTSLSEFNCSGSGDTEIRNLSGDEFTYDVSGSGDLLVDGEVDNFKIYISGSGDVDARELIANDVKVRINGSGDVEITALESIEGRISGSGDIVYYGNPEKVGTHVSGSGSIRKR